MTDAPQTTTSCPAHLPLRQLPWNTQATSADLVTNPEPDLYSLFSLPYRTVAQSQTRSNPVRNLTTAAQFYRS
ncbi:MAG: hypothetical protein ACOVRM_06040 [Planctomycetaceae bacterium]